MSKMFARFSAFLCFACLLGLPASGQPANAGGEGMYLVKMIDSPSGVRLPRGTSATAMNDRGDVCGTYLIEAVAARTTLHAFYLAHEGPFQDLGLIPGHIGPKEYLEYETRADGLNNLGQVAGTGFVNREGNQIFVSAANGGALARIKWRGESASVRGLNDRGQIVGTLLLDDQQTSRAFLSEPGVGTLHLLGTLPGGSNSTGYAVNQLGQVSGTSDYGGQTVRSHAFLTAPNGGALTDLGCLPGGWYSQGLALNSSGQVAGYTGEQTNDLKRRGFVTDPGGTTPHDLGTFLDCDFVQPTAINDAGRVVGWATKSTAGAADYAFVYDAEHGIRNLNDLVAKGGSVVLHQALSINQKGEILVKANYLGTGELVPVCVLLPSFSERSGH